MTDAPLALDPIVSARGLKKSFGRKQILHGLDFDIPAGRIYGLVGHNGAGKTTTLNAMLGLTSYEGTIRVLGEDPFQKRARLMENVAFISDVASLPRFLRVRELFALLSNIHPNFSTDKARQFLEGTDIKPEMKIRTLSKGMVAQLHLAVVMAIDAKLLVLDEPTLGLDITYRKRFYRRLLEDYMTEERTLIITTHQVDEIEFMLSDIMFIRDGDLILHMQMETVSEKFSQLVVDTPEQQQAARALGPVYEETRFGQTVMIFDGVDRGQLEPLGRVSTPTLSDLFVALMQRPTANPETAR
ncbi:ABC transporter ATP-binding protein [Devosia sp. 63-57]|uniref:ABC transporter ATP-binding protein n=1 Tax=Devosia sp. 63-57 TaxID=1895751 RepID=UPI00086A51DE|nr:ABC transporter ATP-binding protein [Devosia sp. 63-57]ODT48937.1 MAG: multidrug ABC transporter ATP-binding protein [Pelagibacterium sp. SCN 63-126]ODU89330.1 MAG: multidrug ABC transporter ATP-binding protein [Pelagibacterium sp. SCN 63-17]OJX44133.1 MAG: multidrug ABC transporter ATP-binding protein [Devosia sp. 63-57]